MSCRMWSSLLFLFFVGCAGAVTYRRPDRNPPQFSGLLNVSELLALGGYSVTNYEVITEDGYSLWLFRLGNNTGPPVLMQHGILVACDQWITRGPGRDLAFILLERGYDVWISNQRGTVFNEYNVNYPKSDPRFWDFSFHESGYYDMPAFIDTVLELTNERQLFYIGHSLGTTVFFVMCSTRPEYNDKIRAAVLLSPVAYTVPPEEQNGVIRLGQESSVLTYVGLKVAGLNEFFPRTEKGIAFLRGACTGASPTRSICLDLFGVLSGENRANLDPKEFDFFIGYYGAGTSLKTLSHAAQLFQTGEFRQYNYGPIENLRRYGSVSPIDYRLRLIRAPVALFWGYNDVITSATSVNRLSSELPNVIITRAVPDPKFTHVDMYLGDNANKILYPEILIVLDKFLKHGELSPYDKGKFNSNIKIELYSDKIESSHSSAKEEPYRDIKEETFSHTKGDSYENTKVIFYPHKQETHSNPKGLHMYDKERLYEDHKKDIDRNTKEESRSVPHSFAKEESRTHSFTKEESRSGPHSFTKEESYRNIEEGPFRQTKEEGYPYKNEPLPYSVTKEQPYTNSKHIFYTQDQDSYRSRK